MTEERQRFINFALSKISTEELEKLADEFTGTPRRLILQELAKR